MHHGQISFKAYGMEQPSLDELIREHHLVREFNRVVDIEWGLVRWLTIYENWQSNDRQFFISGCLQLLLPGIRSPFQTAPAF